MKIEGAGQYRLYPFATRMRLCCSATACCDANSLMQRWTGKRSPLAWWRH